jgi:hypothetical protein
VAWWSIVGETEFIAAIVGSVVGSVVGGGIAYWVQKSASDEENRRREEERAETRRALGQSLLIKMLRIHSNLYGFHEYIEGSFKHAEKEGFKGAAWQILRPLASIPAHVDFSADELSVLMSLKDNDLFNTVVNLDAVHNNFLDSFSTFNARKSNLVDAMPGAVIDSSKVESFFTEEQMMVLGPKMHEVDRLIEELRTRIQLDYSEADHALDALHALLNDKLKLGLALDRKAQR